MNLTIATSIIKDSDTLIQVLKSKNAELIEDAIHKLTMSILNCLYTGKSKENLVCPLARFIIYTSVLPTGKIEDPAGVNATLTELKWPLRASTFWEMVRRFEDETSQEDALL